MPEGITISGLEEEKAGLKDWNLHDYGRDIIENLSINVASLVLDQMARDGADGACCYVSWQSHPTLIVLPFGEGLQLECDLIAAFASYVESLEGDDALESSEMVAFLRSTADKIEAAVKVPK